MLPLRERKRSNLWIGSADRQGSLGALAWEPPWSQSCPCSSSPVAQVSQLWPIRGGVGNTIYAQSPREGFRGNPGKNLAPWLSLTWCLALDAAPTAKCADNLQANNVKLAPPAWILG